MFASREMPADCNTPTLVGGKALFGAKAGEVDFFPGNEYTPLSVLDGNVLSTPPELLASDEISSPAKRSRTPLALSLSSSPASSPRKLSKSKTALRNNPGGLTLSLAFQGFESFEADDDAATPKLDGGPLFGDSGLSSGEQKRRRSRFKPQEQAGRPPQISLADPVRSNEYEGDIFAMELSSSFRRVTLTPNQKGLNLSRNEDRASIFHDSDDCLLPMSSDVFHEPEATTEPSSPTPSDMLGSSPFDAPFTLHKRRSFNNASWTSSPEPEEVGSLKDCTPFAAVQSSSTNDSCPVVSTHLASPTKQDREETYVPKQSAMLPPSGNLRRSNSHQMRMNDPRRCWSENNKDNTGFSFRMFNRAPSINGYEVDIEHTDDRWSDTSSVPNTPHSPDPALVISKQPWAGECPPTPTQQRVRAPARRIPQRPSDDGGQKPGLLTRSMSLNDSKVLIQTTQLERTGSVLDSDGFQFLEHFDYMRTLGYSKHSEVSAVRHKIRGDKYAIKRTRRQFQSHADRERCLHEILAVAALPAHRNLVGHYRAWQQGGHFYIQMDLCAGGSLAGILQNARMHEEVLDEQLLWRIMLDAASGLEFLHQHGVTHLDIKPSNIYKDALGCFRVGDFGLAVLRDEWVSEEGDGDYVAPEALQHNSALKPPADIFSLGVTMYECASLAKLPRSGSGRNADSVHLPARSEAIQTAIRRMLASNPSERPTAAEIVQFCRDFGDPADPEPIEFSSGSRAPPRKRRSNSAVLEPDFARNSPSPHRRGSSTRKLQLDDSEPEGSPVVNLASHWGITPVASDSDSQLWRHNPYLAFEPAHSQSEWSSPGNVSDFDPKDVSLELSFDNE